jgi:16S rRNA (uracil1498-N3)-methyltransferase
MPGHRFYAPPETFTGNLVMLDEEEAHHARSVLRLREGDDASVFDGAGREFSATLTEISKKRVMLTLGEELGGGLESPLSLTLAAALLKADKFEWVIQKAVELGVNRIVPLVTEHTEVGAVRGASDNRLVRWRRIALDATKQCGRRVLMKLDDPVTFGAALAADDSVARVFFAERGAGGWRDGEVRPKSATAYVGPEGGWADREAREAGEKGCRLVTLGPRILRAETASVVASTLLQASWGDFGQFF